MCACLIAYRRSAANPIAPPKTPPLTLLTLAAFDGLTPAAPPTAAPLAVDEAALDAEAVAVPGPEADADAEADAEAEADPIELETCAATLGGVSNMILRRWGKDEGARSGEKVGEKEGRREGTNLDPAAAAVAVVATDVLEGQLAEEGRTSPATFAQTPLARARAAVHLH